MITSLTSKRFYTTFLGDLSSKNKDCFCLINQMAKIARRYLSENIFCNNKENLLQGGNTHGF